MYFHVKVAPKHRKFLHFTFQGIVYSTTACRLLPTSLQVQQVCGRGAATAVQLCERVFFYLHNLIVTARSREWAIFHTARLVLHLNQLGFAINWKKSTRFGQAAGCSVRTQMDSPEAGSPQTVAGSGGDSFDCHADIGAHGSGPSSRSTGALAHVSSATVVRQPAFRSTEAQALLGERRGLCPRRWAQWGSFVKVMSIFNFCQKSNMATKMAAKRTHGTIFQVGNMKICLLDTLRITKKLEK